MINEPICMHTAITDLPSTFTFKHQHSVTNTHTDLVANALDRLLEGLADTSSLSGAMRHKQGTIFNSMQFNIVKVSYPQRRS